MKLRQQLALLALVGLLIPGLTLYSLRIFNEQVKNSRLTELTSVAQAIAAAWAVTTTCCSPVVWPTPGHCRATRHYTATSATAPSSSMAQSVTGRHWR